MDWKDATRWSCGVTFYEHFLSLNAGNKIRVKESMYGYHSQIGNFPFLSKIVSLVFVITSNPDIWLQGSSSAHHTSRNNFAKISDTFFLYRGITECYDIQLIVQYVSTTALFILYKVRLHVSTIEVVILRSLTNFQVLEVCAHIRDPSTGIPYVCTAL